MIGAVRHHRALIPLAHDIIAEVASNQIIYTAMSSTSVFDSSPENSARDLDAAFAVIEFNIERPLVMVNDVVNITITVSNIGNQDALAVRIDDALPQEFEIAESKYSRSTNGVLSYSGKIAASSTKTIAISAKASAVGEYLWHPSLVYMDSARNYKIARAKPVKIVVEQRDEANALDSMLQKKASLEAELEKIVSSNATSQNQSREQGESNLQQQQQESQQAGVEEKPSTDEEKTFALREEISKLEESLARVKNEYSKLNSELEQVRADIIALNSMQDGPMKLEERVKLEGEERLLLERVDKRRRALEGVHML